MIPSLLPQPRWGEGRDGNLTLTSPLRVDCPAPWREVLEVFASDLENAVGWDVVRVGAGEPCDIHLRHEATRAPEEFSLIVADGIEVEASTAAGASYALCALRQLGPASLWGRQRSTLEHWSVPRVSLLDGPAFAWRGAHLDVARHFFGVDEVVRFIDLLAAHRLNRLHLHLNDDQGWRVEVPAWPRLTTIGSQRKGSPLGHESEDRRDEVPHGGFYRAEDLALIVEHARRRHVQVIPEIDLPGHAQAVLAAYPAFANTDETLEVWTHWGISENVLNVEPATLDFAEDVVRYVASLFPGSPVHIGGDECPTGQWEQSDAARAVMREHGFENASQLQGLYTQRLSRALMSEGHEVLAWDEVLDAEVSPGTTIVAWRSMDKGIDAARRGLDVVMAPMQYLYLDWLSSDAPEEPVAVAPAPFVTPWEKVYGFQVVPAGLEAHLHHHVRGAQVQLWTEYIDSRSRLDYMAFPRLSAFAEVVWGTAGDTDQFRARLEVHLARLAAMGVSYRPLDPRGAP